MLASRGAAHHLRAIIRVALGSRALQIRLASQHRLQLVARRAQLISERRDSVVPELDL